MLDTPPLGHRIDRSKFIIYESRMTHHEVERTSTDRRALEVAGGARRSEVRYARKTVVDWKSRAARGRTETSGEPRQGQRLGQGRSSFEYRCDPLGWVAHQGRRIARTLDERIEHAVS